jgi:glycosyltransferase involved in cell wall biosynthesis
MKIRVGYIFDVPYILGGGELSFLELIDGIRLKGVVPTVFIPGKGEIAERLHTSAIEPIILKTPSLKSPACLLYPFIIYTIIRSLRKAGITIVHVNGARSMLYYGLAARLSGCRCVWHVRVVERDKILDIVRGFFAHCIIANSHAVASAVQSIIKFKRQVTVIYNGFNIERITAVTPIDPHKAFQLPKRPVLLCAGRFSRWKRFEDVLYAAAELKKKSLETSCIIIGKAFDEERRYEEELRALPETLNLQHVVFPGWRDDVVGIMKKSTVLIVPSNCEPFGRTIIEAWACGLPVIAANSGGPKEIIESEKTGFLYPVGEHVCLATAIQKIIYNDELRAGIVEAAQRRVAEFSVERHVSACMRLYDSL